MYRKSNSFIKRSRVQSGQRGRFFLGSSQDVYIIQFYPSEMRKSPFLYDKLHPIIKLNEFSYTTLFCNEGWDLYKKVGKKLENKEDGQTLTVFLVNAYKNITDKGKKL